MGIQERKIRQKEEVRAAILRSAWRIVKEEGWQALSIRKIADLIEYSVPVVYTHFDSKDAILFEFTREGFNLLSAKLQKAKEKHNEAGAQLKAIGTAYWKFAFSNPQHYEVMFGLGIPTCEAVQQVAEMQKVSDVMMSSIGEAIAKGATPGADLYLKYKTFYSILHGMVAIQMIGAKGGEPDASKTLILNDAVDGFIKALTH